MREAVQPESIRQAMELAWRDHHHARDQTWKALQIEAILGAGLVSVDAQYHNAIATTAAGALVVIAALFGVLISLHHRKLEIRKFKHITNCERALGLHRDDLFPPNTVALPNELKLWHIFKLSVRNTAVFILRMHFAILLFAILLVVARLTL
ncbi:MAG TPA: hypothetical protein VFA21_08020 [Pyrinomonadaceae bacterium]|nr:hypothetical protein [Pyrinomonadaceae bacterium]